MFNALTRGRAATAAYASGEMKPNIGVAKVTDQRLERLAALFKPQRVVPAEVRYIDIPGTAEAMETGGITGPYLNMLQRCDALVHVVRAFDDPSVPYPKGSVDPKRDIYDMGVELAFADLLILERRMQRVEASLKGAKPQERANLLKEQELLAGIKSALEKEVPIRSQELPSDTARVLAGYQFLTAKPLLVVVNVGEEQLAQVEGLEREMTGRFGQIGNRFAVLCGKLEMELSQMPEEEELEFRVSLGVGVPGLVKLVQLSYQLLGFISFFTVGEDEVRAWTLAQGAPAVKAAGVIHSDLEKGFIRAEVINWEEMLRCGSMAEARKRGLLRQEGKTYPVKDGDVITILFNV